VTLARISTLTPEIASLLALAMWPDPARIAAALTQYASSPERHLWAWMREEQPVCAAGLQLHGRRAELLHIGTRPESRGQGSARHLLLALMHTLDLEALEAETDVASVDFYRRCGFQVEQFEGRWGERYRCLLTASASR
jgi:ribosomal protein S18 acetylase RimI-like enzyme